MAYSVTRSRRELQRLLDKVGLRAEFSKPVIVEGSLTPPPSRLYPGTRCYMATVSVNDIEFHGFGSSPTVASQAAARFAHEGVKKAYLSNENTDTDKTDGKQDSNRNENSDTMSQDGSVHSTRSRVKKKRTSTQNGIVRRNRNGIAKPLRKSSQQRGSSKRLLKGSSTQCVEASSCNIDHTPDKRISLDKLEVEKVHSENEKVCPEYNCNGNNSIMDKPCPQSLPNSRLIEENAQNVVPLLANTSLPPNSFLTPLDAVVNQKLPPSTSDPQSAMSFPPHPVLVPSIPLLHDVLTQPPSIVSSPEPLICYSSPKANLSFLGPPPGLSHPGVISTPAITARTSNVRPSSAPLPCPQTIGLLRQTGIRYSHSPSPPPSPLTLSVHSVHHQSTPLQVVPRPLPQLSPHSKVSTLTHHQSHDFSPVSHDLLHPLDSSHIHRTLQSSLKRPVSPVSTHLSLNPSDLSHDSAILLHNLPAGSHDCSCVSHNVAIPHSCDSDYNQSCQPHNSPHHLSYDLAHQPRDLSGQSCDSLCYSLKDAAELLLGILHRSPKSSVSSDAGNVSHQPCGTTQMIHMSQPNHMSHANHIPQTNNISQPNHISPTNNMSQANNMSQPNHMSQANHMSCPQQMPHPLHVTTQPHIINPPLIISSPPCCNISQDFPSSSLPLPYVIQTSSKSLNTSTSAISSSPSHLPNSYRPYSSDRYTSLSSSQPIPYSDLSEPCTSTFLMDLEQPPQPVSRSYCGSIRTSPYHDTSYLQCNLDSTGSQDSSPQQPNGPQTPPTPDDDSSLTSESTELEIPCYEEEEEGSSCPHTPPTDSDDSEQFCSQQEDKKNESSCDDLKQFCSQHEDVKYDSFCNDLERFCSQNEDMKYDSSCGDLEELCSQGEDMTSESSSDDFDQFCSQHEDEKYESTCERGPRGPCSDVASDCIESSTLDPYDYQSAPDPIHFTVRLPNLAASASENPLSLKPEWKKYCNGFTDPTVFTSGLVCTSDGTLIHRSKYISPVVSDSDESKIGDSDSESDDSVMHKIEDLDISVEVPGKNETRANGRSTNSLPVHYLLAEANSGDLVTTKKSHAASRAKFRENGLDSLFKAESRPKLCIGLPSEGPLPNESNSASNWYF